MGKQSAPAPPNYAAAAEQQGQSSIDAINAQTQANRPNVYTPWGSSVWTQGGGGQGQAPAPAVPGGGTPIGSGTPGYGTDFGGSGGLPGYNGPGGVDDRGGGGAGPGRGGGGPGGGGGGGLDYGAGGWRM